MARGWESKSIEEQQAERSAGTANGRSGKKRLTAEQQAVQRQRDLLGLSRTRILKRLAEPHPTSQKQQLERALVHLEAQLKQLQSPQD